MGEESFFIANSILLASKFCYRILALTKQSSFARTHGCKGRITFQAPRSLPHNSSHHTVLEAQKGEDHVDQLVHVVVDVRACATLVQRSRIGIPTHTDARTRTTSQINGVCGHERPTNSHAPAQLEVAGTFRSSVQDHGEDRLTGPLRRSKRGWLQLAQRIPYGRPLPGS